MAFLRQVCNGLIRLWHFIIFLIVILTIIIWELMLRLLERIVLHTEEYRWQRPWKSSFLIVIEEKPYIFSVSRLASHIIRTNTISVIMTKGKKRTLEDADPDYDDYEDVSSHQNKRQMLIEQTGKEESIQKMTDIIKREFSEQEDTLHYLITEHDELLHDCRHQLERLRGWLIASYYQRGGQADVPVIHPTVKHQLGKAPRNPPQSSAVTMVTSTATTSASAEMQHKRNNTAMEGGASKSREIPKRGARFKTKKKVIVGNVSRYIQQRREMRMTTLSLSGWYMCVQLKGSQRSVHSSVKSGSFFIPATGQMIS